MVHVFNHLQSKTAISKWIAVIKNHSTRNHTWNIIQLDPYYSCIQCKLMLEQIKQQLHLILLLPADKIQSQHSHTQILNCHLFTIPILTQIFVGI